MKHILNLKDYFQNESILAIAGGGKTKQKSYKWTPKHTVTNCSYPSEIETSKGTFSVEMFFLDFKIDTTLNDGDIIRLSYTSKESHDDGVTEYMGVEKIEINGTIYDLNFESDDDDNNEENVNIDKCVPFKLHDD